MLTDVILSPWAGGVLIGLYIILQQWVTNKPLGCSTPFGSMCALVSKKSFFKTNAFTAISAHSNIWFLVGIFLGGFISTYTAQGSWSFGTTLDMGTHYNAYLPDVDWLKALVLILGGTLAGIGARLANGCASGHSMSGLSMLNPISLLATVLFFIGGLIVVNTLNFIFPLGVL